MTAPTPEQTALLEYKAHCAPITFDLDLKDALDMAYLAAGCVEVGEIGWGSDADRAMATLGAAYLALAALAQAQAAEAQVERLRTERDAYRQGVTYYANLQTNYQGAVTRDMLDEIWQTVKQTTDQYGCAECSGKTFEDGMICCWTCGREMPDAQAQAEAEVPERTRGALVRALKRGER